MINPSGRWVYQEAQHRASEIPPRCLGSLPTSHQLCISSDIQPSQETRRIFSHFTDVKTKVLRDFITWL